MNVDNPYFQGMVNQVYPDEVQMNKPKTTYTEAPSLNLNLCTGNGFVSSKILISGAMNYTCIHMYKKVSMVTFLAVLLILYTFHSILCLLWSALMFLTTAFLYI